jgi:hypothetical protein
MLQGKQRLGEQRLDVIETCKIKVAHALHAYRGPDTLWRPASTGRVHSPKTRLVLERDAKAAA